MKTKKNQITAKYTVEEDSKELIELMLEKSHLTVSDIFKTSLKKWINQNIDLLSENEKQKYKHLFA